MRGSGERLTWLERRKHHVESVLEVAESHYQTLEDVFTERMSHEDLTARQYGTRLRAEQRAGSGEMREAWVTLCRLRRWHRLYKMMCKQAGRGYYDSRGIGTGG